MKSQLSIAVLLLTCASGVADVTVPPILADHMVLQREMPVPIWGTAEPGEKVAVTFAGQTKRATADAQGKWRVNLDALKTSADPRELTVKGKNVITLKDVLVGEVWVGSGQSNMYMMVTSFAKDTPYATKLSTLGTDTALLEAAAVDHPTIRFGKTTIGPFKGGWTVATAKFNTWGTYSGPSALLLAFGVNLQKELNGVPVGLIMAAVSGSPTGCWLTEEMFRADAGCQAEAEEFAKTYDFPKEQEKYQEALAKWKVAAEEAKRDGKKPPREPSEPLPAGASGALCSEDNQGLYWQIVRPLVPYAVRGVLWDQGESGTDITGVKWMNTMHALIVGWRKAWGQDFPFLYVQKPSGGGTAWDIHTLVNKGAAPNGTAACSLCI